MAAFPGSHAGFLSLSNEVLLTVFQLCTSPERKHRDDTISSLRLTCRRFCQLCSDYPVRRCGTFDFSRPESLKLFRRVIDNPRIAEGVREVNVRLHFYHPWAAASFDNFRAAILSEWVQRVRIFEDPIFLESGQTTFEDLMRQFVCDMQLHHDESTKISRSRNTTNQTLCAKDILQQAYKKYKKGYDSQMLLHGNGAFAIRIAWIMTRLPNISHVRFYDGDLENDVGIVRMFDPIDEQDILAHRDILEQVLSRPMLWEEARWIQPNELIWPGVPTRLLVEIPLALGAEDSLKISKLSVHVSSAPDYTTMQLSRDDQDKLSNAIKQMGLVQFRFKLRVRVDCGPFISDEEWNDTVRTASEMEVINEYLGAIFNSGCIAHADINLREFWYSLGLEFTVENARGLDSIFEAPTPVGIGFTWPSESDLSSIKLVKVPVTITELRALVAALGIGARISFSKVCIQVGLWRDALQILRDGLRDPQPVYISWPLGGGITHLTQDQWVSIFHSRHTEEGTMAECYVMGKMLDNPLDLANS
ncbi:hypothetical protein FPANT_7139 [Fusarium pseudoanthophilum]|uniref:F-box domain-containing protein n=1 Tax=Fusarium pseudoanthophilum TaxID=48495 RepID=A0A8H5LA19_9HYPO|nr:hypothetical protein FPANT_7139 [Fusarium pseudoanthophilum]